MATRLFSTLVPTIAASAPGCPTPTIIKYVRDAAIEACERTLYWRYRTGAISLTPLQSTYNYPAIVDGVTTLDVDIHAVFGAAFVDGPALRPLTLEAALQQFPQWDATSQASQPQAFCQLNTTQYIVLPKPETGSAYTITLTVALKPTKDATGMDEDVLNELEDVIVHNTLQRLLILPNQNWSDRESAGYHARQYLFKLTERRARANLGNMRGSMSVRLPPFGA